MQNARDVLLKTLTAIDYSDDKETFADEFLKNVNVQALLDLFNTLPQDKKDQIHQQTIKASNSPQVLEQILKSYFTQPQIEDALQNTSKNAVAEYIKAIDPTLSEAQRANLVNLSKELNQNNPSVQPSV